MIRKTISRRRLFHEQWKYICSGLVMFIVVNRISITINMTIANLALEVLVGALIYTLGLVLTRASIIEEAQKLIGQRFSKK